MGPKIVIVGGVAGGASAAAKARRVDEQAQITIFERGPYVSFANCGLPYYVGGQIPERSQLLLQTPEAFAKRFRVRVRVLEEIVRIDRVAKQVHGRRLATGESFVEPYDKLILAPGAGAIVPPLVGIHADNIFTIKTIPDSDAIRRYLEQAHPTKAVIVGAGFIGLEAAEVLARRGLDVTLVELQSQVLPPFDPDIAVFMQQHLEAAGVQLILGDGLKAFHGGARADDVELESGRRVPLDLAILSIGVRPELALAQAAGLAIGQAGGIVVNEFQQTADPDIYAAGDAVEVTQLVTGQKTRMPLAGLANKQGRVAGANAAGERLAFRGALGTAIVESLGMVAAKTGLSERDARQAGFSAYVSLTHPSDHATYYPGSAAMHMKLVVEQETGRLLGAQIVGEQGVDKRIDVLATALMARMRVTDLEQLDLAYAPQFSSAKDPVVMAGFVAANVLRHDVDTITCAELEGRLQTHDPVQVVDVRTPEEHAQGHLSNAKLIPIDELRERIHELDARRETVVYCRVGLRGYLAARILAQHGFPRVRNLTGGILMCRHVTPVAAVSTNGGMKASVAALHEALDRPDVMALDIREPDEYRYERIAKTRNLPLGQLTAQLDSLPKNRSVFVVCQTGARAEQALAILHRAGCAQARLVTGGLNAWKAAGYPVQRSPGPLPIMRQVQIVAGSLVLLGGLIPGWRWLAAIVGAGLVFAGISGYCGMAMLLARLPWNRAINRRQATPRATASCASAPCSSGRDDQVHRPTRVGS